MKELSEKILQESLDLLENRYTCRSFSEKQISDKLLQKLLRIGSHAATGGNLQPCTIMAVRDPQKNKLLQEAANGQGFVGKAPLNLVFFLDWHRLDVYAKQQKAAFTQHKNMGFLFIAMMDVLCAAQSIESAATLAGIHSCYVGSICGKKDFFCEHFGMPTDKVYPVVLLSMGYPKSEPIARVSKLDESAVVGYERYPSLDDNEIPIIYDKKYAGMERKLPLQQEFRQQKLDQLYRSLSSEYPADEVNRIVAEVDSCGYFNEMQRKFTFQYPAEDAATSTEKTILGLHKSGIMPQLMIDESYGIR